MGRIDTAQIDNWLKVPSETPQLEFKEAKSQMAETDVCEYCVAIANEGGGHLVLGLTDKIPRKVVGTTTFQNPIQDEQRFYQLLRFRVDIKIVNHPDGRVVVFCIPARPAGSAYSYKGKYLMRCGSQLTPMDDSQLRKIFNENKVEWLEDICLVDASATQVIELLDVQAFFDLLKQPYPTNRDGVISRLIQEQLIVKKNDTYSIKRMCALLFAKTLSLFTELKRKAPRVIVYNGINKLETKLDKIGDKGYAVGFAGLIEYIMSQLPQNEVIKDSLRHEVTLVPDIVIRELVANALIHQDFDISGIMVTIEIYRDRVEISNPGRPLVSAERFIDENRSRNERLANLMRRMGICEEKGSGIDKVVDSVEAYQLPAPEFVASSSDKTSVVLYGYKTFEDMTKSERIRACYQHACLRWVMRETMTNQSLRNRFKLSDKKTANISQLLTLSVSEGVIKVDESVGTTKKYAKYLPYWA